MLLMSLVLLNNVLASWTLSPNKCVLQFIDRSTEATCAGIPSTKELEKFDKSTTHLSMLCAKSDNGVNGTLQNNLLVDFPKISFFHVSHCKLVSLPNEFFKDLIHLENVVLDNLRLEQLQNNVFKNSSNLLELTLTKLEHLQVVYPRFMGQQNKLTKLYIINSNVTSNQMKPILLSVYVTLVNLHWSNNKQKLFFHKTYFRDFVFDHLLLENNGIDNTEFLFYVRTKYLSLKNNPISTIDRFTMPRLDQLESLNLEFTGLSGTFPDRDNGLMLPSLKELIISNNRIENLLDNIDIMMPRLKILDLRHNRLTTLPSSLQHMLTKNAGRVLLSSNRFHCNCEMKWLARNHPLLTRQILCRTRTTYNGTKQSNATLATVLRRSELLCIPPKLQMELSDHNKSTEYSVTIEDNDVKVYTVVLDRRQVLNWKCKGVGDPAPKLKWIFEGQTYKVTQPPLQRYETRTVMTDIFVEQNNYSPLYICTGTNVVGNNTVKLRLIRDERFIAQPAKSVSLQRKNGNTSGFSVTLLILLITFTYLLR